MVRTFGRRALPVVAAGFVVACLFQVFLAGLGVFDDPATFLTHTSFGYMLGLVVLVMLVLAIVAREPRRIVGLAALLLAQFALQSLFVGVRVDYPMIAALHPVNGFLILGVGIAVTRMSWAARNEPVSGLMQPSGAVAGS
jgi:mercuric ion transport protein